MTRGRQCMYLFGILAGAFALRSYVSVRAFYSTFDTSTVGLMACRILEGERPLFFYGQHYMGALEAYLAAGLFSLFGRSLYTLSLSPILFSLGWILATWALVKELYGPRVGLAAAVVLSIPGWHTLWFNVGSYGGYPGCYLFGSLALYGAVLLWTRRWDGLRRAICIAGIGAATGLAVWTNFQSAPWLLLAGGTCLVFALRNWKDPWLWFGAAMGLILLLLCATPVVANLSSYAEDPVTTWGLKPGMLERRMEDFVLLGLRFLAFSRAPMPAWWRFSISGILAAGACVFVVHWAIAASGKQRALHLAPLLFLLVYLVLSLPHEMASTHAPRYLIPFWIAACLLLLALPCSSRNKPVTITACSLLLGWSLLHLGATVVLAERMAPKKQRVSELRDTVVAASAAIDHPPAFMAGGRVFGYQALNYNFWSGGQTRFASMFDDRNRRTSTEVESAPRPLLIVEFEQADRVKATLDDLRVPFTHTNAAHLVFLKPEPLPSHAGSSIYPLKATLIDLDHAQQPAEALVDRTWDTSVGSPYAEQTAIRLDLPAETELDSLVLCASDPYRDGLPIAYEVAAFDAAGNLVARKRVKNRFAVGYVEESRVILKGYFGVGETALGGVRAASLVLRPGSGAPGRDGWHINEIYVFPRTTDGDEGTRKGLVPIVSRIEATQSHFVMANRTVSAWLNDLFPHVTPPLAYARYNPRFEESRHSRIFEPGMSLVVAQKYAPECRRLLGDIYGEGVMDEDSSFPPWHFIHTRAAPAGDDAPRLVWTGHTLMRLTGPEPTWHTR